jgi:hypothetical protein
MTLRTHGDEVFSLTTVTAVTGVLVDFVVHF